MINNLQNRDAFSDNNFNLASSNNTSSRKGGEFHIEITLGQGSEDMSQQMADAVLDAAQFWENIITQSSFNGDHILSIEVGGEVQAEDILASATWTEAAYDANDNIMPTEGIANINTNSNTVDFFDSDIESFTRTMIHEFGHVMGIGSLWEDNNLIDPTTATYNADTNAGMVYGQLLGLDTPEAIPLTTGEGQGSDLVHWDEEIFSNELMTHAAEDPGWSMPLSVMTLASLQDLGWNVDYDLAEFYPDGFTGPETASLTTGSADNDSGCGCGFCGGCNNDILSTNLIEAIAVNDTTI